MAAGIYVSISNASFTNCAISGNASIATGGGIYSSNPTVGSGAYARFYHCTVSGNRGSSGGGGYFTTTGTEPAKIYNFIFFGNKTNAGVAINDIISSSLTTDDPEVYYSVVGNVASTTPYAGMGGNSTVNPLFTNAEDALNAPTLAGNYRMQKCSPAINTGENTYATSTRDLDANSRIAFTTVDKGAYEKLLALPDANGIVYVESSNSENEGDGSSWDKAITQLGDAMKAAKFNTGIQEIWVAKGTYKPIWRGDFTTNIITDCPNLTDRDNSFVLVPDVKVYGGFAGGETDTSSRDLVANETILSGDFSNNDIITGSGATLTITNNAENAYHVLISAGAVGSAEINGFAVTRGYAAAVGNILVNGQTIERIYGSGMYNVTSSPIINNCVFLKSYCKGMGAGLCNSNSSPSLFNCRFSENFAVQGSGIGNKNNSTPTISQCIFSKNRTINGGAGVYNISSSPIITNCIFSENSAVRGGGIDNSTSSPIITGCSFLKNTATNSGGGLYNIGLSYPILNNCIFTSNSAVYGGGLTTSSNSSVTITNSTFTGNLATYGGGIYCHAFTGYISHIGICTIAGNGGAGIYNDNAYTHIKNSIIWDNSGGSITNVNGALPTVSNNVIQGGYVSGSNILDIDPLFVSPEPPASAPTHLGDYRLQACSPAINIGNNADVSTTTDVDNNPRIVYSDVDLGAYEQQTNIYADGKYTTWKGINNDWHNKINWCGAVIPTYEIDVTIPATSNNPVLSNTGETKNIVLNNATSITTTATGQLTINGTYTNSGSNITNNGTWVMAGGETNQTFPWYIRHR